MSEKIKVQPAVRKRKKSQLAMTWGRLRKNKTAVAGLVILAILGILIITAGFMFDYDADVIRQNASQRLKPPSGEHWMGTDEAGRDIMARVIYGTRVSLPVAFGTIAMACAVGGLLGVIAGYGSKRIDNIIMRIMDIFLAIPSILMAMAIVAALGNSMMNLMIAIAVSNVPPFARIVRASVITIKNEEYIEAERAIGASDMRIIFSHVIPNALAPIIVQTTTCIAGSILAIAGLSFIGLGIQPPTPEWGSMLSTGRQFIRHAWWVCAFPGLAIMISILSLNLFGDGLRDALDPKLKN